MLLYYIRFYFFLCYLGQEIMEMFKNEQKKNMYVWRVLVDVNAVPVLVEKSSDKTIWGINVKCPTLLDKYFSYKTNKIKMRAILQYCAVDCRPTELDFH
jgi:hypothetical protein